MTTAIIMWLWVWGMLGFYAWEKLESGSGRWWRSCLWPFLIPLSAVIGVARVIYNKGDYNDQKEV